MKYLIILMSFAVFFAGCAAVSETTQPLNVKLAEGLDPSVDTVDQECAFFYFMWGRTAELDERFEEAREAYEKALVCDLHASHVMRRLATLLVNMGKERDAANWMQRIIDEDPADESSRGFLANLYIGMEQYDKAEEIYGQTLKEHPEDENTRLLLVSLFVRQKKYQPARDLLEDTVKKNPGSFLAHHYLARIYQELGLFGRATKAYEKALSLNWSPMLASEYGDFLEGQGLLEESLKVQRTIVEDDENNEVARNHMVGLLFALERTDEAIKELIELKSYSSNVPQVDLNIGRILLDHKRYDEAAAHLKEAVELDPAFDSARVLLAVVYHESGDDEKAVENLKKVGPSAENYEEAVQYLVQLMAGAKHYSEAEAFLRERIADPKENRGRFYLLLAAVYLDQDRYLEAEKVFQAALVKYPADARVHFKYALLLDERGRTGQALTHMEKVLELSPGDPFALNYIGYTWADQGRNLDKALEYIKEAVRQKPDDGYVLDSLGWVLFKLGRKQEARRKLERAVELVADDPTLRDHLGDVYHSLGKVDLAVSSWEMARKLFKDEKKKTLVRLKIKAVEM